MFIPVLNQAPHVPKNGPPGVLDEKVKLAVDTSRITGTVIASDKAFFFFFERKVSGPSCSKLIMSLVNVSLKNFDH